MLGKPPRPALKQNGVLLFTYYCAEKKDLELSYHSWVRDLAKKEGLEELFEDEFAELQALAKD